MPEAEGWDRYRFKRDLELIEQAAGRGTELVSLFVPPGRQIADVTNYLRNELSQSSNIKSKQTRNNVSSAIQSILGKLKVYRVPPPNGIVFFVGHKSIGADQTEMVSFVLEPPEPVPTFLYRCDSKFFTEPLRDMLREKSVYGLLVIDRSEATVGLLRGKRIEVVKNVNSQVPSKHGRGGQSQRRFERLIEQAAHEFYKKIGDLANEVFLQAPNLEGLLVGGPGYTKTFFADKEYLHHELKKKLLGTFDTGYTDEYGLKELVENARDVLQNIDLMREKRLVQRLMEEIRKEESGLAVYGEAQVRAALAAGQLETLLLSEGVRRVRRKVRCAACGFEGTITSAEADACPECGGALTVESAEDLIDEMVRIGERFDTAIAFVSTESEEGEMFLRAFGGVAGMKRYR